MGISESVAHDAVVNILGAIPSAVEQVASEMGERALGRSVLDGLSQYSPIRYLVDM